MNASAGKNRSDRCFALETASFAFSADCRRPKRDKTFSSLANRARDYCNFSASALRRDNRRRNDQNGMSFQENMMTTDVQVEPSPRPAGAVEGNYLFTDCTLPRTAIWSWSSAGLLILGVLTFCAKLLHLQTSRLAGDEFEHIHAAWLVYNHQIPYADFFEHHTPFFYFIGAAILPFRFARFDTLIQARYLGFATEVLVVVIACLWARRRFGSAEAMVIACLFCTNVFFYLYAGLTYLDTYALPFLMLSAVLLRNGGKRGGLLMAVSGAAFAMSVLIGIKAVMAAPAYIAYFVARAVTEWKGRSERKLWFNHLLLFGLGGVLPCLLIAMLLGRMGLHGFWMDVFVLNSRWKSHHFPYDNLRLLAVSDPLVYGVAIVGAIVQFWSLCKRGFQIEDRDIPVLFLASLCLGIFLLPVVWEEYFLLLVPFAVIVAGLTLTSRARKYLLSDGRLVLFDRGSNRALTFLLIALFTMTVWFSLPRTFHAMRPALARSLLTIVLCGVLFLVLRFKKSAAVSLQAAILMTIISVLPLKQQAYYLVRGPKNQWQRQRVNYVLANTRATSVVFDGYSGFGVFRQHAFKYWLLHDEMQAMLSAYEKGPMIVEVLEIQRPPIFILDRFTLMLPQEVQTYVATHYEATPFAEIKKRKTE